MKQFLGASLLLLSTLAVQTPAPAQVTDSVAFPNLSFISPVGLYPAGDGTDRLFVLEQTGTIKVFPNIRTTTNVKEFLNLHDSISSVGGAGEMGLLGLAFHPQYGSNGYFYVDYTTENTPDNLVHTRISRFQVSANADSAIRTSELVLLDIQQPYENHKGGQLAFGPDGYLYIGMGDGGSGGDPENRSQSDTSLLGKILRINVDAASGGKNYSIPPDNPYADSTGKMKEIFIKGVRNPWRFSFDNTTLWAGDVGQNTYEEIDTVVNGKNYGWRTMEGFHCYNPPSGCNQAGLTLPLWEYDHGGGRCSITGGFVYRGANIPQLTGKYIYGDYCSGQVWMLDVSSGTAVNSLLRSTGVNISSFGVDKFNELYFCDLNAGKIRKFKVLAPGTTLLASPANGQTGTSRTPLLTWRMTTWATSYRLQVSTDSTFATTVFDDSTITDTTKQVGLLDPATKYYWRVRAKNSGGSGPYSTKRNFTTLDDTVPPAVPLLVAPPDGAIDEPLTPTLTWNQSDGAKSYRIQIALDAGFTTVVADDSVSIDSTWQPPALTGNTTYYWHVSAINAYGASAYSSSRTFTTAMYSASYHILKGWNMVSLPVVVQDGNRATIFPTSISHAYRYLAGSSYIISDSLIPGVAYWVKFADSQHVVIAGTPILSDTVDLSIGWNMVGTITNIIPTDSTVQVPPGISNGTFFGYSGSYFQAASLQPSYGYWIKATAPGKVIIFSNGSVQQISGDQPVLARENFLR